MFLVAVRPALPKRAALAAAVAETMLALLVRPGLGAAVAAAPVLVVQGAWAAAAVPVAPLRRPLALVAAHLSSLSSRRWRNAVRNSSRGCRCQHRDGKP